jgi:hypothetical protein
MKYKTQKGYAIMFTVILVSIISLIGIGLANTTYKQLMLSSGARDSQLAFYMSDMATECALYADNSQEKILEQLAFSCGVKSNGDSYDLTISYTDSVDDRNYVLTPDNENSIEPCFRINIEKKNNNSTDPSKIIETTIEASGYNICNLDNKRTVERTIQVKY